MASIIVGIDCSERAPVVLAAAHAMAERLNARVVIVSAVEGIELYATLPPELAGGSDASLWLTLEKQAQEAVESAAATFAQGRVLAKLVQRGAAWRVMTDAAKTYDACLIVVGAHGYHPLERMLGTTAAKVATRAATSVLVVRQPSGANAPVGFERVLVAHDATERTADDVLASAVALATPSAGRLILLHAISSAQQRVAQLMWKERNSDAAATLVKHAREALNVIRGTLPALLPSEADARIGPAWQVIVDTAKEKDATLVVIGSRRTDTIDRVLGTVTDRVVNGADRSVLIVRGKGVQ